MTNREQLPEFAEQWLQQRQFAAARMAQLRLDALRSLTELDAARMFAQLEPPRPWPLRPTSGLVMQQAIFQRWWRSTAPVAENDES